MASVTPVSTLPPLTTSDTTISFHPFTTSWAAPSECSNIFMAITTSTSYHLTAFYPEYGISINKSITCLPAEFTEYRSTGSPRSTQTYLGPFTCPGGWVEATTSVISSFFTKTMCCPSGYDKVLNEVKGGNKVWGTCVSSVDPNQGFTYAYLNEDDKWIVTTNASTAATNTRAKHLAYRTVIGYTGVTGFNTAPVSSTSLPTTASGADSGSGLSTGAKAGIGVGVSLGVTVLLALFGFVYFLGRRRRKSSSEKTSAEDSGKSTELPASEPYELDGKDDRPPTRQELQSKGDAPELQGDQGGLTQELEGVNNWPPLELEATNPGDKVTERNTGDINT